LTKHVIQVNFSIVMVIVNVVIFGIEQ